MHRPARHGELVNAEPHRCAKIGWFPADLLPSNSYPNTAVCVAGYRAGRPLELSGWR